MPKKRQCVFLILVGAAVFVVDVSVQQTIPTTTAQPAATTSTPTSMVVQQGSNTSISSVFTVVPVPNVELSHYRLKSVPDVFLISCAQSCSVHAACTAFSFAEPIDNTTKGLTKRGVCSLGTNPYKRRQKMGSAVYQLSRGFPLTDFQ